MPRFLKIERNTSTRTIVDTVRLHFQETIEIRQAQRLKAFLMHDSLDQHRDQFQLVPSYLEHLQEANAELYFNITVDEQAYQFRRVFVCPAASKRAFAFGLPFLALDGTFLKTRFRQTLLVAVSRDTNNEGILLAWAIAEGESASSWSYFLDHLITAIPEVNTPETVIISDRDKDSMSENVNAMLPLATRAWCCWHIAQNVRRRHGEAAEKIFWRLAKVVDAPAWDTATQDLGLTRDRQAAINYLQEIDRTQWATRFFPSR